MSKIKAKKVNYKIENIACDYFSLNVCNLVCIYRRVLKLYTKSSWQFSLRKMGVVYTFSFSILFIYSKNIYKKLTSGNTMNKNSFIWFCLMHYFKAKESIFKNFWQKPSIHGTKCNKQRLKSEEPSTSNSKSISYESTDKLPNKPQVNWTRLSLHQDSSHEFMPPRLIHCFQLLTQLPGTFLTFRST